MIEEVLRIVKSIVHLINGLSNEKDSVFYYPKTDLVMKIRFSFNHFYYGTVLYS